VTIPRKERPGKNEAEEISTLLDGKVKVYPDGRIKIIKNGKEVREAPKKRNSVKRPKQQGKTPKKQGKNKMDIKQPAAKKFKKTN
jgi:acylphosphatase